MTRAYLRVRFGSGKASARAHPTVVTTDPGNETRFTSFTGEGKWPDGLGYIPCKFTYELAYDDFDLSIEGADCIEDVDCSPFSMSNMIRKGWKFTFEPSRNTGDSPSGHTVTCFMGDDTAIRIPHKVRTGKHDEELPVPEGEYSIGSVSNSRESDTGNWLHGLFNPSSSEMIWRTRGVTSGDKQPASPFQECFCVSCATTNAMSKGPKHTQYCMLMIDSCNVGTEPCLRDGASCSTPSDAEGTESTWLNAKPEDSEDYDSETDTAQSSKTDRGWLLYVDGLQSPSRPALTSRTYDPGRSCSPKKQNSPPINVEAPNLGSHF